MSIYRIKMNGKVYEMEVELIDSDNKKVDASSPERQIKAVEEHHDNTSNKELHLNHHDEHTEINENTVTAPMNGTILEVFMHDGDKVKAGDTVLILEAMKMENEICSPRDGVIKSIYVENGMAVSPQEALFELEAED